MVVAKSLTCFKAYDVRANHDKDQTKSHEIAQLICGA